MGTYSISEEWQCFSSSSQSSHGLCFCIQAVWSTQKKWRPQNPCAFLGIASVVFRQSWPSLVILKHWVSLACLYISSSKDFYRAIQPFWDIIETCIRLTTYMHEFWGRFITNPPCFSIQSARICCFASEMWCHAILNNLFMALNETTGFIESHIQNHAICLLLLESRDNLKHNLIKNNPIWAIEQTLYNSNKSSNLKTRPLLLSEAGDAAQVL